VRQQRRDAGRNSGIMSAPIGDVIWLAIAVLAAGIVTGIFAGLFGVGGGGVIVPVLFEVFRVLGVADEVRMQLCVGTSLAIMLPTTLRSYCVFRVKSATDSGMKSATDSDLISAIPI
jgi:hypothetical protein